MKLTASVSVALRNQPADGANHMKKLLIGMLTLMVLSGYSGPNGAQERKAVDKASPKLFIGKVTQVDESTDRKSVV